MIEIVYAATKVAHFRNAPADAMKRARELQCSRCGVKVMVVKECYDETVRVAELKRQQLSVVCMDCLGCATNDAEDVAVLHLVDPKIESLLARHHAEMN